MTYSDVLAIMVRVDGANAVIQQMQAVGAATADIGKLFASAGSLIAVEGIRRAGAELVGIADSMTRFRLSSERLMGPGFEGFVRDVNQYAKESAFAADEVRMWSQRLLAMNVAVEEVVPTMRMLSDVTAALGGDTERFARLAKAYTDVRNAGRVLGPEIRQLAEVGFPIAELAKELGLSIPQLLGGGVSFADFDRAFRAVASRFEGLSDILARQSLVTRWRNILDALSLALIPIGNAVVAILTPFAAVIERLVYLFDQLPGPIREVLGYILTIGAMLWIAQTLVALWSQFAIYAKMSAFWMAIVNGIQIGFGRFIGILRAIVTLEAFRNVGLRAQAILLTAIAAAKSGNWLVALGVLAAAGIAVGALYWAEQMDRKASEDAVKDALDRNTEAVAENTKAQRQSFGVGPRSKDAISRNDFRRMLMDGMGS